jgi:hypothetical protein
VISLTHPVESPSGNKFHKRHWSVYSAWKQRCVRWATSAARVHPRINSPSMAYRAKVTFTCYRGRLIDSDNLVTGLKALRDSLVVARLIEDDSPKWAEFTYSQEKRGKTLARTEITIEPIPPTPSEG